MDTDTSQRILDQVKAMKWKSALEWVKGDPDLFSKFCDLPTLDRRKAFPYLSDRFHVKLKPNANIGALFPELSQAQWQELFRILKVTSLKSPHKWALVQYRNLFGELPPNITSGAAKLTLDPLLSDEQIIEFILTRSAPLTRSITLLFSSKMEISRKWSILNQMTELNSGMISPKTTTALNKIKKTFQKHQAIKPAEIRRVLDSLLTQHRKDIESFPNKYLPILVQDVQEISLLYIRIKKGGLKPKQDKSNRPQLFLEIYDGRDLFRKMVTFFEIQREEIDKFPFLEKVLRLQHLSRELFGYSDWPNVTLQIQLWK